MSVPIPKTLRYYIEHSSLSAEDLENIFGKSTSLFDDFLREKTLNENELKRLFSPARLRKIATYLDIALPFLFCETIYQQEEIIPDFRGGNQKLSKALQESIKDNKRRQDWLRDYFEKNDFPSFEQKCQGDFSTNQAMVQKIKEMIGYHKGITLAQCKTNLEKYNILVCQSGTSKHTHSKIKDEIRGYAIYDTYTPLIFLLSTDSENGKIFTLMHELAHILLRKGGISGYDFSQEIEYRCNEIAGEVLMPTQEFLKQWEMSVAQRIEKIAKYFCVSKLAVKGLLTQQNDC